MSTDTLYNESYVKHTPYYHEEVSPIRNGEAGEPLSYSIVSDDYVALGMMLCIVVSLVSVAKSWRFICYQTKNLFRMPRENSFEMRETLGEMQYQIYFWLQGMALYAILAYAVAREYVAAEYQVEDYPLLAIFFGVVAVYFLLRGILNSIVLPVFFPKGERHLASISRTFLVAVQGAFMLPVMLLHLYCQVSVENTLWTVLALHVITLLLRFYKTYCIFFRKNNRFLQFFLYLCTLEAVPFALLIGALGFTAHFLKINI